MDQHNEDLLDSTTTRFYLFAHLFDYYVTIETCLEIWERD